MDSRKAGRYATRVAQSGHTVDSPFNASRSRSNRALDWYLPPPSFYTRSLVTTYTHVAVFVGAGFYAVWRGRSVSGAAAAGLGAQIIAAPVIFLGTIVLIAVWHDPQTLEAIERSGGIGECFTLPLGVMGPAVLLSMLGGAIGTILCRSRTTGQ